MGVFGLYALLGATGSPTFYDKLLCVPLLNLSVQAIDRMVHSIQAGAAWNRSRLDRLVNRPNLAHMAVWIVFFAAMAAMGKTDGRHVGDSVPFWEQACVDGRRNACKRLIQVESTYCGDNTGWACNELGGHYAQGEITSPDPDLAQAYFTRACEARFQAGCANLLEPGTVNRADPRVLDLRLMLREGGRNLMEMPERELYARACAHQWTFACVRS